MKGEGRREVELKYAIHGPVIYEDDVRHRAYALKWVGTAAGGAGYLSALKLARAKNWAEFRSAVATYKIPSENLVYADREGNIGWIAAGQAPIRKGWQVCFPFRVIPESTNGRDFYRSARTRPLTILLGTLWRQQITNSSAGIFA